LRWRSEKESKDSELEQEPRSGDIPSIVQLEKFWRVVAALLLILILQTSMADEEQG
jgi:hypothetical protein